jgi:hypothetical protein
MIPTQDELNFIKKWSKKAAEVFDHMGYTWGEKDPVTADMIEQKIIQSLKGMPEWVIDEESGRIEVSVAIQGSIELESGRRFKLRLNIDPHPYSPFDLQTNAKEPIERSQP